LLHFVRVPEKIKRFELNREIEREERETLSESWAFYVVNYGTLLSFDEAPYSLRIISKERVLTKKEFLWKELDKIDGIPVENIVKNLLLKSILVKCFETGLVSSLDKRKIYFPKGLLNKNKISFKGYDGRKTTVSAIGEQNRRQFDGSYKKYFYHLSPKFTIKKEPDNGYCLQVSVQLYFDDEGGYPLNSRSALSARKRLCKNWWNRHWLLRNMAVIDFISGGKDKVVVGKESTGQVEFDSSFIKYLAPVKLIENQKTQETDSEVREELVLIGELEAEML